MDIMTDDGWRRLTDHLTDAHYSLEDGAGE